MPHYRHSRYRVTAQADASVQSTHQWRNALRRNIAVNCSLTRLNMSWMAVVLPRNVALILSPFGGMSQICSDGGGTSEHSCAHHHVDAMAVQCSAV